MASRAAKRRSSKCCSCCCSSRNWPFSTKPTRASASNPFVSRGIDAYRRTCDGTLIIITHNTRILERVDVDRVHVMVKGRMVHEGPASLIEKIDTEGFEQFEQAAQAAQA